MGKSEKRGTIRRKEGSELRRKSRLVEADVVADDDFIPVEDRFGELEYIPGLREFRMQERAEVEE